jgi:hypothetical protein
MAHILLSTATRKPFQKEPTLPAGAQYDIAAGCWMLEGSPLVSSDALGAPSTKKNDLETGEDQKGE